MLTGKQERNFFSYIFPEGKENVYSVGKKKPKSELIKLITDKLDQLEEESFNSKWITLKTKMKT